MRKGERAEMNQESNYISIAEFSKRANISKQRVYQLLNKSLKDFVKEVDGVKMLHIQALERYQRKENKSRIEQGFEQDFNNPLNDTLIKTIELLQEQLKAKDKQIENLQKLLDQAQMLNAMDKKKIEALEIKLEEPNETDPVAPDEPPKGFFSRFFKK